MTVHIKTPVKFTERKRNPPYGMSESFICSGTSSRLWDPDDHHIAHWILKRFILKPTQILSCLFLKTNFINIFPPVSSSPKRFCFPVSRQTNYMYVLLMSLCDAGHVYFIIFESITVTIFAIAPHRIWRSSLAFIKTHTTGSFNWETVFAMNISNIRTWGNTSRFFLYNCIHTFVISLFNQNILINTFLI